jgi:hypothetical protein
MSRTKSGASPGASPEPSCRFPSEQSRRSDRAGRYPHRERPSLDPSTPPSPLLGFGVGDAVDASQDLLVKTYR